MQNGSICDFVSHDNIEGGDERRPEIIMLIHGYRLEEIATALHARRAVHDDLHGALDRAGAEQALNAVRQQPWFSADLHE